MKIKSIFGLDIKEIEKICFEKFGDFILIVKDPDPHTWIVIYLSSRRILQDIYSEMFI